MGNPKLKWTAEEEEALRAGVKKHGTGKWKNIQRDPEFTGLLSSRSNIDLKDKWRNLTVSATNGSIPRGDKSKAQRLRLNSDVSATPLPIASIQAPLTIASIQAPLPIASIQAPPSSATPRHVQDVSTDVVVVVDDTSNFKVEVDVKTASKYDSMVYEAFSKLTDPNGSDIGTIVSVIEQKHDVAPNFRRLVGSRLRRLVAQGKLEKVDNAYRIKGLKPPAPKPKDPLPRQVQTPGYGNTIEDASVKAASWIADIENKSFVAEEAVKEAERVSIMSEDADAFLDFADDIFERSSFGRIVLMV